MSKDFLNSYITYIKWSKIMFAIYVNISLYLFIHGAVTLRKISVGYEPATAAML